MHGISTTTVKRMAGTNFIKRRRIKREKSVKTKNPHILVTSPQDFRILGLLGINFNHFEKFVNLISIFLGILDTN